MSSSYLERESTKSVTQDSWKSLPEDDDDGSIVQSIPGSALQGQAYYQTSACNTSLASQRYSVSAFHHGEVYQIDERTLGGSRFDPFARWPVNITKRVQYLLDHGAFVA
jgi:hypothetical protein